MLIELSVKHIVREPLASRYLMILQTGDNKHFLKINIGPSEGESMDYWLKSVKAPRPMTYDLISEIFSLTEHVRVSKIIIDGCDEEIYFAKLIVQVEGIEKVIDCRPSDAVAIGMRLDVPIYAEGCVLDKYGMSTD